MDLKTLESWLWEAACAIRGPVDAPKYKDYILPLVFLKRLSDVFDDELARLQAEFGELAQTLVQGDPTLVRFYIPPHARWGYLRALPKGGLGERLTDAVRAVAQANPALSGVVDVVDFNATAAGQRIVPDDYLKALIEALSKERLGLADVEPDLLGRAYEYLLRKFSEDVGQSAGEFYTPRMVGVLMARLLRPEPGQEVYDPACGSAGLLIKAHLDLLERHGVQENGHRRLPAHLKPLRLYGQEFQATTYALGMMNAFLHDMTADIRLGDTMANPRHLEGSGLKRFDLIVANPMWNQAIPAALYEGDPFARFGFGIPPASSADWGWVQHMLASLKDDGRMAVVLDTGAVSRGSGASGSNKERDIRRRFVEADLVEAVVLLPENLFFNTTAPGVILVVNRAKRRPGEILLVNASRLFVKGRPKNEMTEEHVGQVARLYHEWRAEEGLSAVIGLEEAARHDHNLSPSRYVSQNGAEEALPLEEAVVRLREAEEERQAADAELDGVLRALGLGGLRA